MAHVSLYRRYRPDTFDKVIGQGHIVRTLVNQIKTDNINHAYLFTGTRGTGKTSVARIFARAINCEHPVGGSPCGVCDKCVELKNPSNMDIIEIDAASNSTVDEIRDLREKVKYPPVVGRYKVYIIDEVHMLSTNAFNALLKTLEEPPSHVVFILATTDVHKLPATILSRCMRFDFKLLSIQELSQNLQNIFKDIGKKCSDEAVTLIATAAEGSVRDSLSIADMCAAYADKEITYQNVLDVLGASDPNIIIDLCAAIVGRNVSDALELVNNLSSYGKNIAVLNKDIANYIRDILYIRNCANSESVLKLPKDIYSRLKILADKSNNTQLLGILDLFNNLSGELRYSTQPRIMFEAAVVRATSESGVTELESRIKRLEDTLTSGASFVKKSEKKTNAADKRLSAADLWAKCRTDLVTNGKYYALGIVMNGYTAIDTDGTNFILRYNKESDASLLSLKDNKKAIENKLTELSGVPYILNIQLNGDGNANDSTVEKLKKVFGDDIKIVK